MIGEFDPIAYAAWVKAHPENYVTMASIATDAKALQAIKTAGTMETLNATAQPLLRAAKAQGDTVLYDILKAGATQRKAELANDGQGTRSGDTVAGDGFR